MEALKSESVDLREDILGYTNGHWILSHFDSILNSSSFRFRKRFQVKFHFQEGKTEFKIFDLDNKIIDYGCFGPIDSQLRTITLKVVDSLLFSVVYQ